MPEITRLKPLYLDTSVSADSAVIVAPNEAWGMKAALAFAEALYSRFGTAVPVVSDSRIDEPGIADKDRIALGCLSSNRLIERLYCRLYTKVDLEYPGTGGRVIQTVHNPEGQGTNVVVVGASSAEDLEDAWRCLLDHVVRRQGKCIIPRTFDVELGSEFEGYKPEIHDVYGKEATPYHMAEQFGKIACAVGSIEYEKRFRDAALAAAEGRHYDHFTLFRFIPYFDALEESPAFDDEQRLIVTNYVVDLLRSDEGVNNTWYRQGVERRSLRHNHQTHAALGIHEASHYLIKYYNFAPARKWIEEARAVFSTFLDGYERPPCDDGYMQTQTLRDVFWYMLHVYGPEARNLSVLKKAVRRLMLWTDNAGLMPPAGDAGCGSEAGDFLRWGEYLFRDPGCRFLLDRIVETKGALHPLSPIPTRYAAGKAKAKAPQQLLGAVVTHMDKVFYDTYAAAGSPRKPNVPFTNTFDKITVRGGWSRDDDFMLFDGISYAGHDYDDGNTVLQFSSLDTVFVTECDARKPRVSDHSSITITRDGLGGIYPPFPELLWLHNTDWGAAFRTCLRDYAGADWYRTILWIRNSHVIVIDELVALQDGDYLLRKHWRLTGSPQCLGSRITTSQISQGTERRFVLETADQRGMTAQKEYSDCISRFKRRADAWGTDSRVYWANAADEIVVARQTRRCTLSAGESAFMTNLFYPVRDDDALTIREIEPGASALLRAGKVQATILCRSAAEDRIRFQDRLYDADTVYLTSHGATILGAEKCLHKPDETAPDMSPGHTRSRVVPAHAGTKKAATSKCRTFGSAVTTMSPCRCDGIAAAVGLENGTVSLLDHELGTVQEYHVECKVNDVSLLAHPAAGRCVLIAAGDFLRCLAPDGSEMWRFTTPYEKKQYAIWRFPGPHALTTAVADINADGRPEIIHTSGSCFLSVLDADGNALWSRNLVFPNTTLALADYRSDGKLCVLSGTGHMSPWADVNVHDADGEKIDRIYVDPWTARLDSLWAGDLDSDGNCEVITGTSVGTLSFYRPAVSKEESFLMVACSHEIQTIRPTWRKVMGDCVTAVAVVGRPQEKRIIAGSTNEHVVSFDLDGQVIWRCDVAGGVVCIAAGTETLCVGTDDGRVVILDFQGRRLGEAMIADIPRSDPRKLCNPRVRAVSLPGGAFMVSCSAETRIIAP